MSRTQPSAAADLTAAATSRTVEIGGSRLHYHDAGEGPALLCIHGGAPGAYGWGNFGDNVAALAEHFRVLVVDLPGYGQSDAIDLSAGRYSPMADRFIEMLDALGIEKAHVVGLATGGAVASLMAIKYAERIDRLVLVSSAGGLPLFSVMPSEGQKHIQGYFKGEGPSPERMRKYLEVMLYDQSLLTDELVEDRYQASLVGAPAEAGPMEQVWSELHRIKAPTLVIWGRDNRVQGYDNALFMLNRIPDVEVHIFGKTGLLIPFERAERFNGLVREFCAG